jgi:hypothetical protein
MTAFGPLPPIACIAQCPKLENATSRREEATHDCPKFAGNPPSGIPLTKKRKGKQTERANITFSSLAKESG